MGVGAIFLALPTLRVVVQCAGGLYLFYVLCAYGVASRLMQRVRLIA